MYAAATPGHFKWVVGISTQILCLCPRTESGLRGERALQRVRDRPAATWPWLSPRCSPTLPDLQGGKRYQLGCLLSPHIVFVMYNTIILRHYLLIQHWGCITVFILMNFFPSGSHFAISVSGHFCCSFVYCNVEIISSINFQVYCHYMWLLLSDCTGKEFLFLRTLLDNARGLFVHVHSVVSVCHPLVSYIYFSSLVASITSCWLLSLL